MPPVGRKPSTAEEAEIRSNKVGESGSEMEVEESKPKDKRPTTKSLSPAKADSGSQVTETNRRVLSPTQGSHWEGAVQKRYPTLGTRQENRALEEKRRRAECRDQEINRTRGSALVKTARQVNQEQGATKPELTCAEDMQVDESPFLDAPTSKIAPAVEDVGAPVSMEFE